MLRHIPPEHPIQKIKPELLASLEAAQGQSLSTAFRTARDFCEVLYDDLKLSVPIPADFATRGAREIFDLPANELALLFGRILRDAGVPEQALPLTAVNLAHRTQLRLAFSHPDLVSPRRARSSRTRIGR